MLTPTPSRAFLAILVLAVAVVLPVGGCQGSAGRPNDASPGATYRGPQYLYGTVGSLTQLKYGRTLPVTGYGIVVDLAGTGSNEVPPQLKQWLINDMTKRGVGLARYDDILPLSPEELLASDRTAVVRVLGFIPPGAVAGTRFDVLVEAADRRTISLAGGRLWESDLAPGGGRTDQYVEPVGIARGAIFVSPTDPVADTRFEIESYQRRAVVASGGVVKKTRPLELVLNLASRSRATAIANCINERFPAAPGERLASANAISPLVIQLSVPARFHRRPGYFVDLVRHLSTDRSPDAVPLEAQRLAEKLIEDPTRTQNIRLAWEALGPAAGVVLRRYYTHERVDVSLAALHAGAALGDESASKRLMELASHDDVDVRLQVAGALVNLPSSVRGARALRTLLDDPIVAVRIAAYESLVSIGHPLVERTEMIEADGSLKMVIDRVPVEEPLVYITQRGYPRLVIFGSEIGFSTPTFSEIWNGRLMVRRSEEAGEPAELFFQRPEIKDGKRETVSTTHSFFPTLATLAYVLGHQWTGDNDPQLGFNLTYGEVVDAVYQLVEDGGVNAQIHVDRGLFTQLLEGSQPKNQAGRPETASVPNAETVESGDDL
ncbi:MAG: flagellar basal body P-ring protein FlgI [Algisphaera sp.]